VLLAVRRADVTGSVKDTVIGTRRAPPEWRCPIHDRPLEPAGDDLRCPEGHGYRRLDGIPRFVDSDRYAESFGVQWNRYRRTQLDSYTKTTLSRQRARRCIGEAGWSGLRDSTVLECGCGAGRFTEVLLAEGAHVTSVDLSRAVDANQENFPQGVRHRIAQADVTALPFAPRQFDLVFCLGVIQHTPAPERTIECLYEQVRPGGLLVIDHYTYTASWFLSTKPLFRAVLRRLSPETAMRWSERIVDALLPLHARGGGSRHLVYRLLSRLSPVYSFYASIPELPQELQREWALLDTHDALTDHYKRFRTLGQIEGRLRELGLEDIHCVGGGNGIEARARRPHGQ
jgi:2-polyprenyl-3-methyl-5-hydroxy-6-metoxy-1,4-benzoquinol methylase